MSYEAQISVRKGERRPVYGQASTISGTLAVSQATFTLYDNSGAIVSGFNNVAVTGNTPGNASTVQVWYHLDTSALPVAAPFTLYNGLFTFHITSSGDSLNRIEQPDVQIILLPPVEAPWTYDTTTLTTNKLNETRAWLRDFANNPPIWTDAELNNYLILSTPKRTTTDGVPILAAALAYDVMANDTARQASVKKIAIFMTDKRSIPEALRAAAQSLRDLYASYGGDSSLLTDQPNQGVAPGIGAVTYTVPSFLRTNPLNIPTSKFQDM